MSAHELYFDVLLAPSVWNRTAVSMQGLVPRNARSAAYGRLSNSRIAAQSNFFISLFLHPASFHVLYGWDGCCVLIYDSCWILSARSVGFHLYRSM